MEDIATFSNLKLLLDASAAMHANQHLRMRLGQGVTRIDGVSVRDMIDGNEQVIAKIEAELDRRNLESEAPQCQPQ